ncbi:MAG: PhoU family transcriptional regulator [Cenarchaeum symbiont of Oopsacas minuta]|nr:PhoU family transcriptional regulator [Cenarchaeum symbiont of Oopsacas minuta]
MDEQEEARKIQFTGKSSYIVSLPKIWITEMGLKRGDQVRMRRQGATEILISPQKLRIRKMAKDEAIVEISSTENADTVMRKIISLYFMGFKTIKVKPKNGRLCTAQRAAVKDVTKRLLMGAEIIYDSSSGVTLQVLVSLIELTVDGAFKRMIHLAKAMLSDAIIAAGEENTDLAKEVIQTDDEVDRFGFYIIRQIEIAVRNEHMLKEIGFSSLRSCLGYRIVVKNIERTGDQAVLIAMDLIGMKKGLKKSLHKDINRMSEFAMELIDEACLAMFKDDYVQAEKIVTEAAKISLYEEAVLEAAGSGDRSAYQARRIAGNLRRIAEYASDIAEIVLNMTVEKTLKN